MRFPIARLYPNAFESNRAHRQTRRQTYNVFFLRRFTDLRYRSGNHLFLMSKVSKPLFGQILSSYMTIFLKLSDQLFPKTGRRKAFASHMPLAILAAAMFLIRVPCTIEGGTANTVHALRRLALCHPGFTLVVLASVLWSLLGVQGLHGVFRDAVEAPASPEAAAAVSTCPDKGLRLLFVVSQVESSAT